jgi:predicted membrane protein
MSRDWNYTQWQQPTSSQEETTINDSEFIRISSVFSGSKRTVISKHFQGGDIACVCGGAEIDLSQADIQGIITIKIEQVFGGTKLIIPPHWKLVNDIEGVFHGVDDKRNQNTTTTFDANKTLVLKGSVVFGGIDVRSY